MKKVILGVLSACAAIVTFAPLITLAGTTTNDFEIIPESQQDVSSDVTEVGKSGGSVWDKLNQKAAKYETGGDIGAQFASGAFTWNTILNYVVYLVRFLSQVALVVGAGMIVFAGYKYAAAAFTGKPAGSGDVKNAIIGVLIVIFSYALIKILTAAFL